MPKRVSCPPFLFVGATLARCAPPAPSPRSLPLPPQMGLGKTAQSISVLQTLRQVGGVEGPFLVVAPLSTLPHWQREIQTWTDMVRGVAALSTACLVCAPALRVGCGSGMVR